MGDDLELYGEDLFEAEVAREVDRRRINERAAEIVRAQPFTPPEEMSVRRLLAKPLPVEPWAVDQLMSVGHNVLLAAEYKAGKTDLLINLMRSFVDGRQFLSRFATVMDGRVYYMNYELTEQDVQMRMGCQRIRNQEDIKVLQLRGEANPLATEEGRAWLVQRLKRTKTQCWVIDTFRAAYTGVSHNDNAEVGKFTRMLDEIKQQAGVPNMILSHHFGRKEHEAGREHGQGAVELDNWADMRWLLVRGDSEETHNIRYLSAEGRNGGLSESALEFDPPTHRITLSSLGEGRSKTQATTIRDDIVRVLHQTDKMGVNEVTEAVGRNKRTVAKTLADMVKAGEVVVEEGANSKREHSLADPEGQMVDFG